MFKGKKYYSEFHDSEESISTNILADRLAKLETNEVVRKRRDPGHGSRYIYSLTDKGLDLIPMMLSMVDWAEKYDAKTEVPPEFISEYRKDPDGFSEKLRSGLEGPD